MLRALAHENTVEKVQLWYTDDDGDKINVSNLEDWQTALEWVRSTNKSLKLNIEVVKNAQKPMEIKPI